MLLNYIFDFDGTLADTFPAIYESWNRTCLEFKLEIPSANKIKSMMGWHLVTIAKEISQQQDTSEIIKSYKNNYSQLTDQTQLFNGIKDVLEQLKKDKKTLFVVSAKSSLALNQAIVNLNLREYFEEIIGAEDVTRVKPDPEAIDIILDKYGLNTSEAVMIGDALVDIQMGQNAKVKTCVVTWGACSHEQTQKFGANWTIDQPYQILKI